MRVLLVIVALYTLVSGATRGSDNKDTCKYVKKEVDVLQSPSTQSLASLFCSSYNSLFVETVTAYTFTTTTDSAIGPITEYPVVYTTLPPGTLTDTLTEYLEEITITTYTTIWADYDGPYPGPTDWTSSTVTAIEVVEAPFTTTTTIVAYSNPLPTALPNVISTACGCLSLPSSFTTESYTFTDTFAYTTITAPLETFTNYQNIIFDQTTTILPITTTEVTIPVILNPIRVYITETAPYPTIVVKVTSTIGGGNIGTTTTTNYTKKPKATKTKMTKAVKPTKPPKVAKLTIHH